MIAEILIVDDNSDIRNILKDLISDAGFKTRVAANYNQALKEIDSKLPDVAILDVKLDKGDNDGIELLSHIKSKNKDIPVIMISGHANIEMAISSLKHGAFEFIEKPFDQPRLLNFVSRAVENIKLKNQNKEYENKLFSSYDLIGNSKKLDTQNLKSNEEEDDDEGDDEEEIELEEFEFENTTYYTEDPQNGNLYECLKDGEIGEIIGHLENGSVFFS